MKTMVGTGVGAIAYLAILLWLVSCIPANILTIIGFVVLVAAGIGAAAWCAMALLAGAMAS
jgi:hypothetical protein